MLKSCTSKYCSWAELPNSYSINYLKILLEKFTQAHIDTTNSFHLNLEHCENINRIHDAEYVCTANAAVGESAYTGWLGSRACTQNKIRTVLDVAMLLLFLKLFQTVSEFVQNTVDSYFST